MAQQATITLHVKGELNGREISPTNFDIKDLKQILDSAEVLLNPTKKRARPTISYTVGSGSIRHIFHATPQAVASATAVLTLIASEGNLSGLEAATAKAIEDLQKSAVEHNFTIEISSSLKEEKLISISPETSYKVSDDLWAEAEVYYYGTIVDAGGKNKSNIHLDTHDGLLMIDADKEMLQQLEQNPLYRKFGIRAKAKQNVITGDIDKGTLKLIEIFGFEPKFDKVYLEQKIQSSTPVWTGIDADTYLHQLREGSYAE